MGWNAIGFTMDVMNARRRSKLNETNFILLSAKRTSNSPFHACYGPSILIFYSNLRIMA